MRAKLKLESIAKYINVSENNSKAAWKIFNSEKGISSESSKIVSLESNGQKLKSELDVANCMTTYYSTVVEEIAPVHNSITSEDREKDE